MYDLQANADKIGNPDVILTMDAGTLDYDTLWTTSSLRGVVDARWNVETLQQTVHSGDGGGIAPETFDIVRHILDRFNNSATGRVVEEF